MVIELDMLTTKNKTYKFSRTFTECTQRGYVVGVVVKGRKCDLAYFAGTDAGYSAACCAENSMKQHGQWIGRKREWSVRIKGKTVCFKKFVFDGPR